MAGPLIPYSSTHGSMQVLVLVQKELLSTHTCPMNAVLGIEALLRGMW